MKRPPSVTILLWLVLSLTAWAGLRLVTTFQWWGTLQDLASPPGPLYIAISAGVWLLTGIGLLWGMWQRKAREQIALIGTGAGFSVWYWCDRLFVQRPNSNWPFALGATVVLLLVIIICVYHPHTQKFFTKREHHDR